MDERWEIVSASGHVRWWNQLGYFNFAEPVISQGLVWIGMNNAHPRGPAEPASVLMCFRERDGKFLWQYVIPQREGVIADRAPSLSCSPMIEGDWIGFLTSGAEVICLDVGPLVWEEGEPKEVWRLDLAEKLGVFMPAASRGIPPADRWEFTKIGFM